MNIKDPTIYPVIFSIGKRSNPVIEGRTAVAKFFASGNRKITKALYSYSGNYLTDCDLSSSKEVRLVPDGKRASFEIIASSMNIQLATINLKTWTNERSSFISSNSQCEDVRQSPFSNTATTCSFYESSNMKRFNPVVVDGVSYYPSIRTTISFYPEYTGSYSISTVQLDAGSSETVTVVPANEYGVLSILFVPIVQWYYDIDRTLLAETPESLQDILVTSFGARIFFVRPGKFSKRGSVDSDGVCVFDGVLTKEYVLSSLVDYGSFSFFGYNSDASLLFYSKESQVIIDQNGYCSKPGTQTRIYSV